MDARELVKKMLDLEMKAVGFADVEEQAIREHIKFSDAPLKRWLWDEWAPYLNPDDSQCDADGLRQIIRGYVIRANYYGRCRESVRRLYEKEINFYRTTLPKYKKLLKRLK